MKLYLEAEGTKKAQEQEWFGMVRESSKVDFHMVGTQAVRQLSILRTFQGGGAQGADLDLTLT